MELDKVLELAKLGMRVHPLQRSQKIPILGRWVERATTDETTIRLWHSQYEDCNFGIATGEASGFFVVDLDPKNGGDQSWQFLIDENGVPETVSVRTGSGGTHLYFKYPKGADIRNSSGKIGRGIDIRAEGGQVVAAGSRHPNGELYEWTNSPETHKIAKAPKWLLDLIMEESEAEYTELGGTLQKGNRNNSIYHAALGMARQKASRDFIISALKHWVRDQGQDDMEDGEIEKAVDSAIEAAEAKPIEISDRSDSLNANLFIQAYGSDLMYVTGLGWHHWNGNVWEADSDNKVTIQLFIKAMDALREDALGRMAAARSRNDIKEAAQAMAWAIQSTNIGKIKAALELAKTIPGVTRDQREIDGPDTIWLLNCENGMVDLKNGDLLPRDKGLLITKKIGLDYDPAALAPFWEGTISLSQNGDAAMVDYMHRCLGYSVTGSIDERCFFLAWGPDGNNGKSTILETVQEVLGDYAQMSDPVIITSDTDNRVASSLAKLPGARMVNMNETEEGKKLSEAFIKAITGGDTVQACKKFMEPFEFRPALKLWLRTNEKPVIRGQSSSTWDRVKMVPFEHPIPKELRLPRSEVDERLRPEFPGILAWLVRGAIAWRQCHDLSMPESARQAGIDYRNEQDIVKIFWDECVEQGDKWLGSGNAYRSFYGWCRDGGEKWIMSRRKFTDRVIRQITGETGAKRGAQGETQFIGFRLNKAGVIYDIG